MAYNKTYTDRTKPFSGWYYDDEQNVFNTTRLLTVSLHANSVPVRVVEESTRYHEDLKTGKHYTYKKSDDKFKWYHHNNSELRTSTAVKHYPYGRLDRDDSAECNKNIVGEEVSGYFLEPLCTCFTNEDFNVSVINNYQQAGGDMVEQMWNQVKPFAPQVKKVVKMADKTREALKQEANNPENGIFTSTLTGLLNNGADALAKFTSEHGGFHEMASTLESYLNKSLVLNGARFSYYGGTNLSFNNLGMKFTIFPKWVINKTTKQPELMTVTEQVTELLPYVMGQYSDWNLPGKVMGEWADGILGWNTPPGDFRANSSDVDIVQKGTLKLKIGTQYALTNLVIENAQFSFSRQMVKNPSAGYRTNDDKGVFGMWEFDNGNTDYVKRSNGALSPLYCEVNLQLRPITKYTSQMMERFVNGTYNHYDQDIVYQNFNKNLDEGYNDMRQRFVTDQINALPDLEDVLEVLNKPRYDTKDYSVKIEDLPEEVIDEPELELGGATSMTDTGVGDGISYG